MKLWRKKWKPPVEAMQPQDNSPPHGFPSHFPAALFPLKQANIVISRSTSRGNEQWTFFIHTLLTFCRIQRKCCGGKIASIQHWQRSSKCLDTILRKITKEESKLKLMLFLQKRDEEGRGSCRVFKIPTSFPWQQSQWSPLKVFWKCDGCSILVECPLLLYSLCCQPSEWCPRPVRSYRIDHASHDNTWRKKYLTKIGNYC